MIDYVEEGQKITAKKQNDIINAANSKWSSSTLNNGIDTGYKNKSLYNPEFLLCLLTYNVMIDERPFTFKKPILSYYGVKIHLGSSVEDAKSSIKVNGQSVDDILLISKGYTNLDYVLDDKLYKQTEDKEVSAIYDCNSGWIDTGIYQETNADKLDVYGHFIKAYDEDTEQNIHYYFAITDTFANLKPLRTRVKSLLSTSQKIEILESFKIAGYVYKDKNIGEYCLMRVGDILCITTQSSPGDSDIDWSKDTLSAGEKLSSIHFNDISGTQYYQLFNFDKYDKTPYSELSGKDSSVLIRKIEDKKHTLEYLALSDLNSISVDTEITDLNLQSIEKKQKDNGQYIQLYQFDQDNEVQLTVEDNKVKYDDKEVEFLFRSDKELKYGVLSLDLSGTGTGISGDTNVLQDLKSIITKSDNDNTWHQLYNFETESPDFTGRYMTIGSLDADRVGKVGKLLDANGNVLSCVDILVRDRKDDTLKYMNLTIDDTLVDTYVGGSRTESMMYGSDNFGNVYLELVNFETLPSQQYLKAVLSSNGQKIFKADDKQTWVLVKQMNAKGKMELMYKELMLDVSLSSGFGISCDTETTRTQKSIEKNAAGYIQLHDFPNPTVTTKTTTLNLLSGTFDLLDSNDTVLVRSGTELKYKKLQLKTQLPGGGGGTTGMTTDISVVVDSTYDEEEHTFKNTMKKLSFTNGLLTNVAALPDVTVFTAVEHQAHD